MLKDRILSTLRFFDLQDHAPTLVEMHRFLLPEQAELAKFLDENFEVKESVKYQERIDLVAIDAVWACLDNECHAEVGMQYGYYFLQTRQVLAENRKQNYFYGLKREKLIQRFTAGLKYIPFIRGVALGGSQAMGRQSPDSDIDLLVVTDARFMWLARTLVTAYFQVLGIRRHGQKIANRFCLNHYLAGPKYIGQIKNLYSAMEYARLRPMVHGEVIVEFQKRNMPWISLCFPNWEVGGYPAEPKSKIQSGLEQVFMGKWGKWLEVKLKSFQEPRIKKEKFIVVEADELSFHPNSKQIQLLSDFFKFEKQK